MRTVLALVALCGSVSLASAQSYSDAEGGVLRWLDTLTSKTGDIELSRGQSATNGRLTIQLDSCRYPTDNPASDAEAHLTITDSSRKEPVFSGWMLASSPALSAMEHPRYDVWVLRCVVPGYVPPEVKDMPEEELPEGALDGEATDPGEAQ